MPTCEGNLGYLRRHGPRQATLRAAALKLVQPLNEHIAFTAEAGLNETFLNTSDSGRIVFGFEVGNYIHPKEYGKIKTPVPMDIPRDPVRTADAARRQLAPGGQCRSGPDWCCRRNGDVGRFGIVRSGRRRADLPVDADRRHPGDAGDPDSGEDHVHRRGRTDVRVQVDGDRFRWLVLFRYDAGDGGQSRSRRWWYASTRPRAASRQARVPL